MPATMMGKTAALEALRIRRERNKDKEPPDNSRYPAGAPMYFPCLTCGDIISVPESYFSKPELCEECQALKKLGWLE
jgi:hypothetical protein